MCEYRGCQALDAIAELSREHDEVVTLVSRVRAAHTVGDVAGMAAVARRIAAVLGPHTAVEEQGLFPPLAAEFGDHVTSLTTQHRRIEAILAEAADGVPADPAWPVRLTAAMRVLREHILAEQDGVFPAALANLDAADWEAVDAIRAQVGTVTPAPTQTPTRTP
ncbi:MAG: hemerythrin domain-containing protein [Actinophytocola sp.]|uniref:hemerythrin domain-containing protein n=1 Tax=Actinophytocola sp. TaxID=1872138 RepID=UPI00132A1B4D|nr:hemerythrin domain-containing protein [Actinophytocola sp.]MPZ80601.1 hemerythrin domain-containing protein [Actinophytocola sp.]